MLKVLKYFLLLRRNWRVKILATELSLSFEAAQLDISQWRWWYYHMQLKLFSRDSFIQWITLRTVKKRQLPLEWCWVHVKARSMCAVLVRDVLYLLKMCFSFSAASREEERTPVPKISENASEHRADCVQSVYNCVSCEPCQPSMLGSHAPFPVTLLYTRESQLILYIFNHFTLQLNSVQNLSCLLE